MSRFYRIALIGDSGVGKTSFAIRVIDGLFDENTNSPTKDVTIHSGCLKTSVGLVNVTLVDTPGHIRNVQELGELDAVIAFVRPHNYLSEQRVLVLLNELYKMRGRMITSYCRCKKDLDPPTPPNPSSSNPEESLDPWYTPKERDEDLPVFMGIVEGFTPTSNKTGEGVRQVIEGVLKSLTGNYELTLN